MAGALLKVLGGDDFELTVTRTEVVTDHYVRLGFTGGGLLKKRPLHPTMWIRMWFDDAGRLHQRGYTLVDADPAADTFDIEFAIHDGIAARWAQQARVGDTITVTVMGSKFAMPEGVEGWIMAGDPIPAGDQLAAGRHLGIGPARDPGPDLDGIPARQRPDPSAAGTSAGHGALDSA